MQASLIKWVSPWKPVESLFSFFLVPYMLDIHYRYFLFPSVLHVGYSLPVFSFCQCHTCWIFITGIFFFLVSYLWDIHYLFSPYVLLYMLDIDYFILPSILHVLKMSQCPSSGIPLLIYFIFPSVLHVGYSFFSFFLLSCMLNNRYFRFPSVLHVGYCCSQREDHWSSARGKPVNNHPCVCSACAHVSLFCFGSSSFFSSSQLPVKVKNQHSRVFKNLNYA